MKYTLEELIDIEQFQQLQDRLNEIYCFPSAIVDNDGKILTATAWQDICTKFHRANHECEKECIKSDQYILDHLHEANPAVSYRCPHGLIDNATPIIIEGVHLGSFFTGQFFFEEPDLEFFRRQAVHYGFDEEAYLAAVQKVPVWSQKQLDSYLFFIKGLIEVISSVGLKNLREIENRKRVEDSEARFRTVLETTTEGFWLADTAGQLLLVNEAYCGMSGYEQHELLSMKISDLDALEDHEAMLIHMRALLEKGHDRFESRHRRRDGQVFDVEVNVQILPGETPLCVAFTRDITESKRAEQALRESEEKYRLLVELSPDAIFIIVGETFAFSNSSGLELLGARRAEELVGIPWTARVHPEMRQQLLDLEPSGLSDRETLRGLVGRLVRLDGTAVDVEIAAIITRHDGEAALQITARDISDRVRAEAERERMQEQLAQAHKMESVGRLAGGVAHDFNNMLGVILGQIDLAADVLDPAHPISVNLKEIESAATRSADLTRQLLAFARKQTISPQLIDLNRSVEGMLSMLRRLIGEHIELLWRPGESLWPVRVDPSQVDQILANLCVNARDAVSESGSIVIETRNATIDAMSKLEHHDLEAGDYVVVSVSDNGVGMDPETLENLFEPFFTTKATGEGTGLGLATVFGAVRQNDGWIEVDSEPGLGTTFRIYLPRQDDEREVPDDHPTPELPPGGSESIMLVEDEPAMLSLAEAMLLKLGYQVLAASSPAEALRRADAVRHPVDLLITDVIMPGMNGRSLADELQHIYPELKRLFVSGYTADFLSQKGVAEPNVHILPKPFNLRDLALAIRRTLDFS